MQPTPPKTNADEPTLYVEPELDTEPNNDKPELDVAIEQRQAADGYAVSHGGTRGEDCSVDAHCERGKPEDWFEVHYASSGEVFHFCARHALAAEALMTLGGWRARDVPEGLRLLERGGARALPKLEHVGTLVNCSQKECGLLAVYSYEWPGHEGPLYGCLPCSTKAQSVARAMGFTVTLRPLPGTEATS